MRGGRYATGGRIRREQCKGHTAGHGWGGPEEV